MNSFYDLIHFTNDDRMTYHTSSRYNNPDINWDYCETIYSYRRDKELKLETLNKINEFIKKYSKIIVDIQIAGCFSHEFALYNGSNGLYIIDNWRSPINKRLFNLDELYSMLIILDKFMEPYIPPEISEWSENKYRANTSTSSEKFNTCKKIWCDFWKADNLTGSWGFSNYYYIEIYISY